MAWTIRLATDDDADGIAAIYRPVVETSPASFEYEPPHPEEMQQRVRDTLTSHPWIVLADDRQIAGYAYATRFRTRPAYGWSTETSAYVHPHCQGRGGGKALYTSLLRILVGQGFATAYAGITLPNDASVRLHESLGFRPVGTFRRAGFKFGRWHDVGWWQLPLREPAEEEPPAPASLDRARQDPEWPRWVASGLPLLREDSP